MRAILAATLAMAALGAGTHPAAAQNVIWAGSVDSRGSETRGPVLNATNRYIIRVSGSVYFGRWWRNGQPLNDDACYEYTAKGAPDPLPVFRNTYGIPVCDGQYRASHVYQSAAFVGRNAPIGFSIFDTDYRDNGGALRVEIIDAGPVAGPGPGPGPGPGSRRAFDNPTMNGAIVDHCVTWATDCGWGGAHLFCQRMGMRRAVSWNRTNPGRTWVIGSNRYCEGGFCVGFSQVVCE